MTKIEVRGGSMPIGEQFEYLHHLERKHQGAEIKDMTIEIDGDYVNVSYHFEFPKFQRIRRITGYLVGDMSRWNDSKYAEEHDRVKHRLISD